MQDTISVSEFLQKQLAVNNLENISWIGLIFLSIKIIKIKKKIKNN